MLDQLSATADRAALAQYGIRVVDVRIKRLNLPEQNKQSVFARMRAELASVTRLNVLSTGPAPALGVGLSDIGRSLVVERRRE